MQNIISVPRSRMFRGGTKGSDNYNGKFAREKLLSGEVQNYIILLFRNCFALKNDKAYIIDGFACLDKSKRLKKAKKTACNLKINAPLHTILGLKSDIFTFELFAKKAIVGQSRCSSNFCIVLHSQGLFIVQINR